MTLLIGIYFVIIQVDLMIYFHIYLEVVEEDCLVSMLIVLVPQLQIY